MTTNTNVDSSGKSPFDYQADEKEVIALSEAWTRSELTADLVLFEKILADQSIFIAPSGDVTDKAFEVSTRKSGSITFDLIETSDVKVVVFGNNGIGHTAILTGRSHVKLRASGQAIEGNFRYTEVYSKLNGSWLVAASHTSTVS